MAKKKTTKKVIRKRVPKKVQELRDKFRERPDELSIHTGSVARSICQMMRQESGDDYVVTVGESRRLVIGVAAPSLSFEYLLQSNVFPLGRLVILVGPPKVGKSALFFEFVRWFRKNSGFGVLLEHESKFSPDWASSIIGWDEPDAMLHIPCNSVEDWQGKMSATIKWVKKEMVGTEKEPRAGKVWPFICGVDSIVAKQAQATQDDIETSGRGAKHWPVEALIVSEYMKWFPSRIIRWPITIVGVNHLKLSKDQSGCTVRNTAGGKMVNFQETVELEVNWAREGRSKSQINLTDRAGMRLRLRTQENSFGAANKEIPITVWQWQEEVHDAKAGEDDWRPVTVWDWHGSTVELLAKLCAQSGSHIAQSIKEFVRIEKVANKSLYYSRDLDVPKSDGQPADVIGKMIYEDKEMLKGLRKVLNIRTWPVFKPGIDMDAQRVAHKRKVTKQEVTRTRVKRKPNDGKPTRRSKRPPRRGSGQ